ncbi:DNA repair protein XRCC4-like [Wolffia australiana]
MELAGPRHTCLKVRTDNAFVFVMGSWHATRFDLFISDGLDAWICFATEKEIQQRSELWDQPTSEYIALSERYLGFQQSGSIYRFEDAGIGEKRLSWTLEKEGTRLEWRWKCKSSPKSMQTTAQILEFLLDSNTRLSAEVVSLRQSFENMKSEAEKCLLQSERYSSEKQEFEDAAYAKFVDVLNSKKAKLRELRDRLSKYEDAAKGSQVQEDSNDSNHNSSDHETIA